MTDRLGTTLSRRLVFSGTIVEVSVDRVRPPDGNDLDMEIVRHPGSVVLIPQPDPHHVFLVRQYRHAVARWLWELPAGRIDPGEPVDAAARRECHEEIGWVPRTLERLGAFYATPGYCDEHMVLFRATELEPPDRPAQPDEHEHLEARLVTISDAWDLIGRDATTDLKTALGLSLLRQV